MKKEVLLRCIDDELEGSLENVIKRLRGFEFDAMKRGFESVSIKIRYGYEDTSFDLYGIREETDEERVQREAKITRDEQTKRKLAIQTYKAALANIVSLNLTDEELRNG